MKTFISATVFALALSAASVSFAAQPAPAGCAGQKPGQTTCASKPAASAHTSKSQPASTGKAAAQPPKVGETVPSAKRGQPVSASQYSQHKLKKPGKGQAWYQINGRFTLVNQSSGVVVSVSANR